MMQAGFSFDGGGSRLPAERCSLAPSPLPRPGYLPDAGFTGAVGRPLAVQASMPPRYQ